MEHKLGKTVIAISGYKMCETEIYIWVQMLYILKRLGKYNAYFINRLL